MNIKMIIRRCCKKRLICNGTLHVGPCLRWVQGCQFSSQRRISFPLLVQLFILLVIFSPILFFITQIHMLFPSFPSLWQNVTGIPGWARFWPQLASDLSGCPLFVSSIPCPLIYSHLFLCPWLINKTKVGTVQCHSLEIFKIKKQCGKSKLEEILYV